MDYLEHWSDLYISGQDALHFLNTLEAFHNICGYKKCWDMKKVKDHNLLPGFSTTHKVKTFYKKVDARLLILSLRGQYPIEKKDIIVRIATCKTKNCINPYHYFYGTRSDVAFQANLRNGSNLTKDLLEVVLEQRRNKRPMAALAREYNVPYHILRRACNRAEAQ